MIETINHYFAEFSTFTSKNPVVSGIVSLWGLGVMTYLLKEFPAKILNFVEKQFTITLHLSNNDESYYHFLKWYQASGNSSKARTIKLNDYDIDDKILSAGYGYHYFFYRGFPFQLYRGKEKITDTRMLREEIILRTFGRRQKRILDLIQDITPKRNPAVMTKVNKWNQCDGWTFAYEQPSRHLDSVILSDENLTKLTNQLNYFRQDKSWYEQHGIPYRLGFCLFGPPGTGKTSLVKALAGAQEKDLYVINLTSMNDNSIQEAMDKLDENAIVLIEDIDTYSITHKRDEDNEEKSIGKTLSGLLNAIDGIANSKGRILIITTNHVEKLDPALMRPGRIDLSLELGYMTDETALKAFKKFYPEFPLDHVSVIPQLTPALFQNLVCQYKGKPEVLLKLISRNQQEELQELSETAAH